MSHHGVAPVPVLPLETPAGSFAAASQLSLSATLEARPGGFFCPCFSWQLLSVLGAAGLQVYAQLWRVAPWLGRVPSPGRKATRTGGCCPFCLDPLTPQQWVPAQASQPLLGPCSVAAASTATLYINTHQRCWKQREKDKTNSILILVVSSGSVTELQTSLPEDFHPRH